MAKATAPTNMATQQDEELPQTAVKPRAKDLLIQQMQDRLAEYVGPEDTKQATTTTQEEETFKKRYGDLRRFQQEKEREANGKIKQLQEQIEQLTALANKPMPKTQAEFEAWKAKYPDIATFIEIIADEKAGQRSQQLQDELVGVKQKLTETEKEKAFATLKVLVPDLEEIVGSSEYAVWFADQPVFVQEELNTSDDPHKIAYYLNGYKVIQEKPTPKAKTNKLDALDTKVKNTGATPSNSRTAHKYTTSQIEKMSRSDPTWYEKNEPDIIAARNAGLILDDTSKRNTVFDAV